MTEQIEYGWFKQYELKDATFKYGFKQQGLFALEPIKKGEAIFRCNPATCDYLPLAEANQGFTRDQLLAMCAQDERVDDFVYRYSYMVDDDKYDIPKSWKTQELSENCMFFNHSCDGNCGFGSLDSGTIIAVRDIEVGEELTYDYQLMDVEPTFYNGLNCKCGTNKCRGTLRFNAYRNIDWITEKYRYAGYFVKRRIDELKTKWYSASCHLKYYGEGDTAVLGLTALQRLDKNELVAIYSDPTNVNQESHYIRHSTTPTLYLAENGEVYARDNIQPATELTLDFNNLQ